MSIDAEKWDNDVVYASEKMIEREKEKEYNISNSKYECNCGKEVLNKDKEEYESNDLNLLYYRKGTTKGLRDEDDLSYLYKYRDEYTIANSV